MAQNDYTRIFMILELIFNYTGHLLHRAFWQECFCVIGRLHKVLSVGAPITHINCPGINFPITHTSVTQKNSFQIICVIISGRIVLFVTGAAPRRVSTSSGLKFVSRFVGAVPAQELHNPKVCLLSQDEALFVDGNFVLLEDISIEQNFSAAGLHQARA